MGDVAGVVVTSCLAERGLGAPVGGAEFGDEFLDGVGVVAESSGEIAVEAGGVCGPVGVFVGERRVVQRGLLELVEVWDVDAVRPGGVVGAVAADHDVSADGGEVVVSFEDASG